ncbi:GtrA family protein [Dictyobacter alpinus]|nr:GtrA family protein [Dictyobacter alpinus]
MRKKFIRFAAIGGIGIVLNDLALAGFLKLLNFYPVAYIFAFAVSNGINFFLNQLITYPEHRPNRTSIWLQRLLKAELTSVSALVISFSFALLFHYVFHVNEFIANPIGLVFSFAYKYLVSDRFVYRPREQAAMAGDGTPPTATADENNQVVVEHVTDPMTPPPTDDETVASIAE